MGGLAALYHQKYGGTDKTAKPDFAPGVKEKGLKALAKKNPALAAAAAKKGSAKTASADAIFDFKNGKIAAAAFMDELRKLNEADTLLLERRATAESPLVKRLREIS